MIDLKFTANPSLTLYKAHELADEVEQAIITNFDHVDSVFVHVEPSTQHIIKAIIPVENIRGFKSKVYPHFGRAPYYVILKIENEQVEIEDFYLNQFLDKSKHIGLSVVKVLVNYDLDMLFTNKIGEISFYMLKENFIDIYQITDGNLSVNDVLEQYRQNNLPRIIAPTHSVEDAEVSQV